MIENALRTHLIGQEALEPYIAKWNNTLAVFNQEAPSDVDSLWNGGQYGRIVFMVDATGDPERKIGATLSVDVMCEKGRQDPTELESIVRGLIDGYFFTQNDNTMMAQWKTSNYFSETNEKVIGVTISFSLLSFPKTETVEPDPVLLMNTWSQDELATLLGVTMTVIGHNDGLESAWKPTPQSPAVYWRISRIAKCSWIPDTYNASWQDATIQGHVFAGEVNRELEICRQISMQLQLKQRLLYDDGSPLFVDRNIQISPSNDPLRTGQISVVGTYGILTVHPVVSPIRHIITREGN